MALSRTGEFGLIRQIQKSLLQAPPYVRKGIGDDAALVTPRPGFTQVVTTDMMVEHVHYELRYTPLDSLGWKALAINLSDLAANPAEKPYIQRDAAAAVTFIEEAARIAAASAEHRVSGRRCPS